MAESSRVELLVGGARVPLGREIGFELFERNRDLLVAGRVETVRVELPVPPHRVLHLVLGAGHLAVIEAAEVPAPDQRGATGGSAAAAGSDGVGSTDEFFPDFDRYAASDRRPETGTW